MMPMTEDERARFLHACQTGDLPYVVAHLDQADLCPSEGRTPLMVAALYDQTAIVQRLLPGSDPMQRAKDGFTALGLAMFYGMRNDATIEALVPHVDLFAEHCHGSVMQPVVKHGHPWLLDAFIDRVDEAGRTLLIWAVKDHREATVERVLPRSNVDHRDHDGRTSLDWARRHGHREVVNLIVAHEQTLLMQQTKQQASVDGSRPRL